MNHYYDLTYEETVSVYADMLVRLAFNNTKNMYDAEDIVQDVYIKLLNHLKSFDSREHLKAWLIRVTLNKCKDHFKSAWFKKIVPLDDQYNHMTVKTVEVLEELFQLDRVTRNIIYLHYYEGYKIKEIAVMTGKNVNTVNSKLQRGRQKLKLLIEEGEKNELR